MDGIILINKDKGITSRDVVNKVCKILNTNRVGHTGTLDPIATGLMVLCVGEGLKLVELLTNHDKDYIAKVKVGIKTDTYDLTGKVLEAKEVKLNKDDLINCLNSFLGEYLQTVPIYSSVKVNGKKLYEYAREKKEVELPKREIDITNIELLSFNNDEIEFITTVSKGTYIRSLIEDICTKLNTVGTMSKLIRTKQGKFNIEDSYSLDDIKNNNYKLISIEEALQDMESIDIDESLLKPVNNGAIINKTFKSDMACIKYNNKIIAIYKTYPKDNKKAKPYIMF